MGVLAYTHEDTCRHLILSNIHSLLLGTAQLFPQQEWGVQMCLQLRMLLHGALWNQEGSYTFAVLTATSITLNILCVCKGQTRRVLAVGVTQSAEGTVHWSLE